MNGRILIRRTRRTDFTAVMRVLAASGNPTPPPDRATLRRFRNLVADLGGDFYLALVDDTLAGLVHVTYARQLTFPPTARLEALVVVESFQRRGIGTALLNFVRDRACRRGCGTFSCASGGTARASRTFLEKNGLYHLGESFVQNLQAPANG